MANKGITNTFIMLIGTGTNALLGLLTIPIITHIVSPEDYGKFSLLQTYISILVALSLLGLEQAYVRYYYKETSICYKSELSKKTIFLPTIISFAITLFLLVFGRHYLPVDSVECIIMGSCVIVTVIETITRMNVRLEQTPLLYSLLLIIHRIAYALIAIILILHFRISAVASLLFATCISLVIIIIIALIAKKDIWFNKTSVGLSVSITELLKYSSPFIFASIANWIFNATGKLSLQHYSTFKEIGYYAAAGNIVSIITILQTTFSVIWVPLAIEHFEKAPEEKSFFIKSNDIITLSMVLVGALVVLFKDVFGTILGGNYTMATYIFPCLILHPVLFTISETTVYGINFYNKTFWHIIITISCCISSIILNLTLTPTYGAKGAAISCGASYLVFIILRTIISNKYFKVKFNFYKMTLSIILLVLFCVYSTFFPTNLLSVIIFILLVVTICIIYRTTITMIVGLIYDSIHKSRINK